MKFIVSLITVVMLALNAAAQQPQTTKKSKEKTRTSRKSKKTRNVLKHSDVVYADADWTLPTLPRKVPIVKDLAYDQHTLEDEYPYKDTTRRFQWDEIERQLAYIDRLNATKPTWGTIQNNKDSHGRAPVVEDASVNEYKRTVDEYGVQQYQSVPLYETGDTEEADRYGRDGSLVEILENGDEFARIRNVNFDGEWLVPVKYLKPLDTEQFRKVVVVDRENQNICTLERDDSNWIVRSMNPATTGLHRPPYQQETPLGIFVVQEKKPRMVYLRDGSSEVGGFAPYASRFTNGAYIHGVPINAPRTEMVEFSPTLGTTPRSHMCVRNATSHAKFVYDWAPVGEALVVVIE